MESQHSQHLNDEVPSIVAEQVVSELIASVTKLHILQLPDVALEKILAALSPEEFIYFSRTCTKLREMRQRIQPTLCNGVSLNKLLICQLLLEVGEIPYRSISELGPKIAEVETIGRKTCDPRQAGVPMSSNQSCETPFFKLYMHVGLLVFERFAAMKSPADRVRAMDLRGGFHPILRFASIHIADALSVRSCLMPDNPTYLQAARLRIGRHPAVVNPRRVRDRFFWDLNSWLFDHGCQPIHHFLENGNSAADQELWELQQEVFEEDRMFLKGSEIRLKSVLRDDPGPQGPVYNMATNDHCRAEGRVHGSRRFWQRFDP